ncbi:MAG: methylated-DNA--[protein]-cysteine S-methyltransferase [Nitrospira sp.]|nr:MAG: methylated-DNA--[protein]-cysteine S-methyltransferase [Nitrospira sp.]
MPSCTLFDTAIGRCGLIWNDRGLAGVQLPEGEEAATRARMGRRWPGVAPAHPPVELLAAIRDITALLAGEQCDLRGIVLDETGVPPFHRRVYGIARAIPPGSTLTYGEIATRLGDPGSARAVGQALGQNPWPLVVPCHRVLAAGGKLGGFSAVGGAEFKRRLLLIEGAPLAAELSLFDD